jgi:hypothetical protein
LEEECSLLLAGSWPAHHPKLKVGDTAPNSKVITLLEEQPDEQTRMTTTPEETTTLHSLLDKDPHPAVLVFGSITCPSFRSLLLKEIVEIIQEQKGAVRLLVVYLLGRSPSQGWRLAFASS